VHFFAVLHGARNYFGSADKWHVGVIISSVNINLSQISAQLVRLRCRPLVDVDRRSVSSVVRSFAAVLPRAASPSQQSSELTVGASRPVA